MERSLTYIYLCIFFAVGTFLDSQREANFRKAEVDFWDFSLWAGDLLPLLSHFETPTHTRFPTF